MTEFQRVPDAESLVEPDPLPAMPDSLDVQTAEEARSMWADAWYEMRRNPMFWISAVLICSSPPWRRSRVSSPARTRCSAT